MNKTKRINMPPPYIKTIESLIYYQYAKFIATAAGMKEKYAFIIKQVQMLSTGTKKMSDIQRELKIQMRSQKNCCEYCDSTANLSWDHLIPRAKKGADIIENQVLACRKCNSSKGNKGLYEWYGLNKKDKLPRVVEGKYLKILYEIHKNNRMLQANDLNKDGKFNVLDLEVF